MKPNFKKVMVMSSTCKCSWNNIKNNKKKSNKQNSLKYSQQKIGLRTGNRN